MTRRVIEWPNDIRADFVNDTREDTANDTTNNVSSDTSDNAPDTADSADTTEDDDVNGFGDTGAHEVSLNFRCASSVVDLRLGCTSFWCL